MWGQPPSAVRQAEPGPRPAEALQIPERSQKKARQFTSGPLRDQANRRRTYFAPNSPNTPTPFVVPT